MTDRTPLLRLAAALGAFRAANPRGTICHRDPDQPRPKMVRQDQRGARPVRDGEGSGSSPRRSSPREE